MKRLLAVVLFVLSFVATSSAELSIVWDYTFDDIPIYRVIRVVPLASGNTLCFYVDDDDVNYYLTAIELDRDGARVNTINFPDPMLSLFTVNARESNDGGALVAIQSETESTLYRINADGDIIDTIEFPFTGNQVYDLVQKPDGSIIIAGATPDLICINPDQTVEWNHNFMPGGEYTRVYEVIPLHSGDYGCLMVADDGSRYDHFTIRFSRNGVIRYSEEVSTNTDGYVPSQFEDKILYIYNSPGDNAPSRVRKIGSWWCDLPNNIGEYEYYYCVQPFNGYPGYFVSGQSYTGQQPTYGIFTHLTEEGAILDTLELSEISLPMHAPAMNGDMICAAATTPLGEPTHLRVMRFSSGTSHAPAMVKFALHNAPRRLPATGGVLHYRLLVGNDFDDPAEVTLNLTIESADVQEEVLIEQTMTLQPHDPVVIPHAAIPISGTLPAGDYTLRAKVFDADDVLLSQWIQTFSKATDSVETNATGPQSQASDRQFGIAASPNPFNAATKINVTLPQTAPLTVRVFDIQGRTVATLADGSSIAAGSHAFSFDGSKLSSGIYFVQATVPGQLNEVRKLMLVK
ncbi:T9SS type A sorting domain-containing protein [bacterium]|nr:T9SS type A sorting domain-containing protein [bacterium]